MKRLFAYIIAILLFPQLISAVILVPRPIKPFSLSQTYIVPKDQKCKNLLAPNVWLSNRTQKQDGEWIAESLTRHVKQNTPATLNKKYCQQKPIPSSRDWFVRMCRNSDRYLCQVLH